MTLPTKILEPEESNSNAKLADEQGKETFLGSECAVYTCPRCNGTAYAYRGSVCPLCQKGKITQQVIGEWD
jgi:rubrerythrin